MAQTTVNAARSSESWLVVAAACISTFVVAYNSTAILTALPAIKSSLDMDAEGLQWIMNAYMLASAVLVAVMGRFADIFGKMRVFLIGLGIFSVGSIGIIFADNAAVMLVGRTCQGVAPPRYSAHPSPSSPSRPLKRDAPKPWDCGPEWWPLASASDP